MNATPTPCSRLGAFLLLALAAACAPPAPPAATAGAADASAALDSLPGNTVISLERTPCFGGCPIYTVTLRADGTVRFEGKRFTHVHGVATDSIDPAAVAHLLAGIEDAGFFSLADRYDYGEPTCTHYVTDQPGAVITVTAGDRSKSIVHDHGCAGAPEQLSEIENRIDRVAGSAQWVNAP